MLIKSIVLASGLFLSSLALAGSSCDCQVAQVENTEQVKISANTEDVAAKSKSKFRLVYAVTVYQEGAVLTKFEQNLQSSIML